MNLADFLPFLIIGVVIALITIGIVVAMWQEKKRREQLGLLAEELGLIFQPDGDAQHHDFVCG